MIPFKVLPIDEREISRVTEVLRSKNLGGGQLVNIFEKEFAEYVGSKYAVAVDSCTSALFLSLKYRALNNEGRLPIPVKIPSMTVPLVANTVFHAGAQIHFVDKSDWVGKSYELEPYGIIDSAHKVSRNQFLNECQMDNLLCFSFYPTKPISSCEGGMICTNDENAVEWLKKARFYGRNSHSTIAKNSWEYEIEFPGWKMNMTEIQAALCIEQLHKLPEIDKKREAIVDFYNQELNMENDSLYLYRLTVSDRNKFIEYMKRQLIECGVHFRPLHTMVPFKSCLRDNLSKTEIIGETTVSIPLYDSLSMEDAQYIVKSIKEWRQNNG